MDERIAGRRNPPFLFASKASFLFVMLNYPEKLFSLYGNFFHMQPALDADEEALLERFFKPGNRAFILLVVSVFVLFQSTCARAADYAAVTGPCRLDFPRDHAAHPDYRTEWWYYTGNLRTETGERYGFQLTFFRMRTAPAGGTEPRPDKPSAWRADQVFAAHAALSDMQSGKFLHAEKMSRAALDLAGTHEDRGDFTVFVNDWSASITREGDRLTAGTADFSIQLDLLPRKTPVPHGDSGYSRKGESPEEASCYYSVTRLETAGTVSIGGRELKVRGTAWMDHEFSSAPLGASLAGWDWFSLQFSDGSDLMIYLMREKNGEWSSVSSGTYVYPDGKSKHLSAGDFRLKVLNSWKSPHSGAVYPSSWSLEVLPVGLRVNIRPNLADQEMQSPESTRVTYWEGSVRADGTAGKAHLQGEGYVELTGYEGSVQF